jgi:hypothetical protein
MTQHGSAGSRALQSGARRPLLLGVQVHHQSAKRSYRAYRVFDRQASGKAVIEF